MPDNLTDTTRKLGVPFPKDAIKQRQAGGGKRLDYVEGHTVIHRLIDATDNQFDVRIINVEERRIGDNTLMMATVELTIPGLGTRQHMGVQLVHDRGGEDLVKGAVTDALKKAATLFGVGLELYGPDYEAGETAPVPRRPLNDTLNGPRSAERVTNIYPDGTYENTERPINDPDPVREVLSFEWQQQRPTGVQRPNNPPTDKQINWAQGMWKQLGHTILGPDGEEHHDDRTLDSHCQQMFGTSFGTLTRGQMSELLNNLNDQIRGGRR